MSDAYLIAGAVLLLALVVWTPSICRGLFRIYFEEKRRAMDELIKDAVAKEKTDGCSTKL